MQDTEILSIIRASYDSRKRHAGQYVLCTLQLGKLLTELRGTVAHGNWESYLTTNTPYVRPREAQRDMMLWRSIEPFLEELKGASIIDMEAGVVSERVIMSALWKVAQKGVMEAAVMHLMRGGTLNIEAAKMLIDRPSRIDSLNEAEATVMRAVGIIERAIDAVAALPEEYQQGGTMLVDAGILDPDIISKTPFLADTGVIEEISLSGSVSLPIGDEGLTVEASKINRGHVELLSVHRDAQASLAELQERRDYAIRKNEELSQWLYVTTIVGNTEEVVARLLQEMDRNGGKRFKVSLSFEKDAN